MTEAEHESVTPDAPRPPGTPEVDLDVDIPEVDREVPEHQDAGEAEPPS